MRPVRHHPVVAAAFADAAAIEGDASSKRISQDAVVFAREVKGITENRVGIRRAHGRLETKPLRLARVFGSVRVADEQF